jgi:hypothetical protein
MSLLYTIYLQYLPVLGCFLSLCCALHVSLSVFCHCYCVGLILFSWFYDILQARCTREFGVRIRLPGDVETLATRKQTDEGRDLDVHIHLTGFNLRIIIQSTH